MIVITLMSVLTVTGIAAYTGSLKAGRDARRKADIEQLRSALELYRSDNSSYPVALPTLDPGASGKKYITLPKDPSNNQNYYYNPTCAGSPSICDTYKMGSALEGSTTACPGLTGNNCRNPKVTPVICNYCVDPYGKI